MPSASKYRTNASGKGMISLLNVDRLNLSLLYQRCETKPKSATGALEHPAIKYENMLLPRCKWNQFSNEHAVISSSCISDSCSSTAMAQNRRSASPASCAVAIFTIRAKKRSAKQNVQTSKATREKLNQDSLPFWPVSSLIQREMFDIVRGIAGHLSSFSCWVSSVTKTNTHTTHKQTCVHAEVYPCTHTFMHTYITYITYIIYITSHALHTLHHMTSHHITLYCITLH